MKRREPIAIVGMGCRFPGADDPESYWDLLWQGVDAVREVPADRWDAEALYDPDFRAPGKIHSRHGGFLDGVADFDAAFFGLSPREAQRVDPQQRLLLEVAHEAMEAAGVVPGSLAGSSTGVFVGIASRDYGDIQSAPSEWRHIGPHSNQGGAFSIAANRLSYVFDLRGPSLAVDTACSSALTALHLAVTALRQGDCDRALVGGVNALLSPGLSIGFSKGNFLSPSGRCHAFSARADGYVRSEGAGVVLLRPLDAALADGDPVVAVLRETGVNEDGKSDGMALPNPEAQRTLLAQVYARAGIAPRQVAYVEAHGTGTPAGDHAEASALGAVLGAGRPAGRPLLVGSAKTNVGHLEAAAGMAGLLKVALCLRNGAIPASLHAEELNPNIPFGDLRIAVVREPRGWPEDGEPRLAGLNSFGFGGANAHAILESPPPRPRERTPDGDAPVVLTLSAKTPEALDELARRHRRLADDEDASLPDVAFSTLETRDHHAYRAALLVRDRSEWQGRLDRLAERKEGPGIFTGRVREGTGDIAFVCSGQGPQWWAMGRRLLDGDIVFREAVEECHELLRPLAGWSLIDELRADEASSRIDETQIAQPALFTLQIGLARRWRTLGVEPRALVGHSVGEVAAAVLADALTLEEGVRVIYHRSRIQQQASGKGRMLAVGLAPEEVAKRLSGNGVSVAAVNRPRLVVLSGDAEPLAEIARDLEKDDVFHRFLTVEVPFHSHHMEPLEDELVTSLAGVRGRDARFPLYSPVTGGRLVGTEIDARFWYRNVREPVRFVDAVRAMIRDGSSTFVELSPHPVLSPGVEDLLREAGRDGEVLPSLRRKADEHETLHGSLARLYVTGAAVRPVRGGRRVALPRYPWQRQRFWLESEAGRRERLGRRVHPFLKRRISSAVDPDDHFWEVDLDVRAEAYLADHRLQGAIVFPGAGHLELALACAKDAFGDGVHLEDVRIEQPLFLPEGTDAEPPEIRFEVSGDEGTFRVLRRLDDGWMRHVSGRIHHRGASFHEPPPMDPELPPGLGPEAMLRRCTNRVDPEVFYRTLHRHGLMLGPAFRQLAEIATSDPASGVREMVARVELDEGLRCEGYHAHPVLLDACFQALLGVQPEETFRTYLPVGAGLFRLLRAPDRCLTLCVRVRSIDEVSVLGDAQYFDEAGDLLIEARDLRGRYFPEKPAPGEVAASYFCRWIETERGEAPRETEGHALVCGRDDGLLETLDARLRACGLDVARLEALGDALPAGRGPLRLVLVLSARGGELDAAGLDALHPVTTGSLLRLVRALAEQGFEEAPVLAVVTRGAVRATADDGAVDLGAAPLRGLARVVQNELAHLDVRLVDLSPEPGDEEVASLLDECLAETPAGGERETALRGVRRFAFRVDPDAEGGVPTEPARPGRDDFRLMIAHPGVLDSLVFRRHRRPPLGDGEVLIQVRAAGLNFKDVMEAMGLLPPEVSRGLFGFELCGTVVERGAAVEEFEVGDEVISMATGTIASLVPSLALLAVRKPPQLTAAEAATLPVAFGTAWYAFEYLARIESGERVLIHSATGGVGLAAIQVARRRGCEVFATAGSEEKRDYLRALGIEHVFDSRSLEFAEQVLAATEGRGVDVVLNSLAGKAIPRGLDVLARFGRFIEIGKTDLYQNRRLGMRALRHNASFAVLDLQEMMDTEPGLLRSRAFGPLAELAGRGELLPLPHKSFDATEAADAIRYLSQARHIGKVVVELDEDREVAVEPAPGEWTVRGDGTYLVTGGTRGLGLAVAGALVERGARHLALLSRSGRLDEEAEEAVKRWRTDGVRVSVLGVDVADAGMTSTALDGVRATMPPLRGVVHGAMVLADGVVREMDDERFRASMRPKAWGALNLHHLTAGDPLDFFVLLSSVSAVVGTPGQGNYAAANLFLEALAEERRRRGQPAAVVHLGAIRDTGVVARDGGLGRSLEKWGVHGISAATAIHLIERTLRGHYAGSLCGRFDWPRIAESLPARRTVFSRVAAPESSGAVHAGGRLADEILRLAYEEREERLVAELRTRLARILGAEAEDVRAEEPLAGLGLDSLMVTELGGWIQAELGVAVPTMQLIRGPSPRELASTLLQELGAPRAEPAPEEAPGELPAVSTLQTAIWRDHVRLPGCHVQNFCGRLEGPLDTAALERSFLRFIDRHPLLRTRFAEEDGRLVTRTSEDALRIEVRDLEGSLQETLAAFAARPMDLEEDGPLRVQLLRLGPEEHVLQLTYHHIAEDAVSVMRLWDAVIAGYRGEPIGESAPTAQTHDFRRLIEWEERQLRGGGRRRLREYWHRQLAGSPLHLDVGTGERCAAPSDWAMATVGARFDEGFGARLVEFATRQEVTPFMVLLTAFFAALRAEYGHDDLVLASNISLRDVQELAPLIGPVIGYVALRARLDGDPSFGESLSRISAVMEGAMEHRAYPLHELVEELAPEDGRFRPSYGLNVNMHYYNFDQLVGETEVGAGRSGGAIDLGEVRGSYLPVGGLPAIRPWDLVLAVVRMGGRFDASLKYSVRLVEAERAQRLMRSFQRCLSEVMSDPGRRLSEVTEAVGAGVA